MITLNNKKGKPHFNLKTKWEELTPPEFINVVDVAYHINPEDTLMDVRLKLFEVLTGYERSRKKRTITEMDRINQNITILADHIRFLLEPHYENPELLKALPEELQEKMESTFPEDLEDADEMQAVHNIIENLKIGRRIRLDFAKNPLTHFEFDKQIYHGPTFNINEEGAEQTDLKVEEYLDACDFFTAYERTGINMYLNLLCSVLYRKNRDEYKAVDVTASGTGFINLDIKTKKAIYMVFQRILKFFIEHPVYGILYDNQKDPDGDVNAQKISTGATAIIDILVKEGYGSRTELKSMNLSEFMALQINQTKRLIESYRAMNKKEHEIAKIMHMSIESINMF